MNNWIERKWQRIKDYFAGRAPTSGEAWPKRKAGRFFWMSKPISNETRTAFALGLPKTATAIHRNEKGSTYYVGRNGMKALADATGVNSKHRRMLRREYLRHHTEFLTQRGLA